MTRITPILRTPSAVGDVIFVHGLGGNPIGTWGLDNERGWKQWISLNRPDLNIWSIGYRVEPTEWTGGSMPLSDRALNILAMLDSKGIGGRPLVFIGHSMGGLLIKEMLRHAMTVTARFKYVAENTKAVVFFATPHAGAALADLASYFHVILRTSEAVPEIISQQARLRDLNLWYRNNYASLDLKSCIFFETKTTSGVRVVNEGTADPGIPQVSPIGIDANHITITKPSAYGDVVVGQTLKTIDEAIPSTIHQYDPDRIGGDNDYVGDIDYSSDPEDGSDAPTKLKRRSSWQRLRRPAMVAGAITVLTLIAVLVVKLAFPGSASVTVDREMYIGHWLGYPQIVMRFEIGNPTSLPTQFYVNSGKLIAPENSKQTMLNLDGIIDCNGSVPTTILIQVEAKHVSKCVYSFLPYVDFSSLTPQLDQALAKKGGATAGPRPGLIEGQLLADLKKTAAQNFQWRPGAWEVRLDYTLGGRVASSRTQFIVHQNDVDRMKAAFNNYDSGYGVYAFWRNWTPDRSQPMPQVEAKPLVE
jgi:pimeloyl-ACP methyl ester carboxylesterase